MLRTYLERDRGVEDVCTAVVGETDAGVDGRTDGGAATADDEMFLLDPSDDAQCDVHRVQSGFYELEFLQS